MMTAEEKLRLYELADEAKARGDIEEYERLEARIPLDPSIAKIGKEVYGSEYMKNSGINLSEAEIAYGHDWLNK